MGPTAAGKTALAVSLVQSLPCEIISVDSAMIYRGMDIGTAKPGPDILQIAPHRLLDIVDPHEAYSAAQFRADALREMRAIYANNKIPLLVGGTMLYFRALEQGLAVMPQANAEVRQQISAEAKEKGWQALHQALAVVDPEAAARIHPNDPQRIQRALEVWRMTGQPMSQHHQAQQAYTFPYHVIKLCVCPERDILRQRIAQRFYDMLANGFIDEVAQLKSRPELTADLPAMRAVGYRQVWQYLAGQHDKQTMIERGITATRQLAKRQLTWLRRDQAIQWYDSMNLSVAAVMTKLLESLE